MTKWCPFCLFLFCKEESFLLLSRRWMVSASYIALLAQVAMLYSRHLCFSFPMDLTVVQKGFSFCSE